MNTTPSSSTPDRCRVPWCVREDPACAEHYGEPGGDTWPTHFATCDPARIGGGVETTPHPTWGESDGLLPGVTVWSHGYADEVDINPEFTPDEARALAAQLIAAADHADATRTQIGATS